MGNGRMGSPFMLPSPGLSPQSFSSRPRHSHPCFPPLLPIIILSQTSHYILLIFPHIKFTYLVQSLNVLSLQNYKAHDIKV